MLFIVLYFWLQPAECSWLIEKLRTCNNEELVEVLRGFHSWSYGKCELYHWTHVLDRFDTILEQASTKQDHPPHLTQDETWVLQCDLPHNAQVSLPQSVIYSIY